MLGNSTGRRRHVTFLKRRAAFLHEAQTSVHALIRNDPPGVALHQAGPPEFSPSLSTTRAGERRPAFGSLCNSGSSLPCFIEMEGEGLWQPWGWRARPGQACWALGCPLQRQTGLLSAPLTRLHLVTEGCSPASHSP